MSTIDPSRLVDVETSATFRALTQQNFEVLAEDTAKRVATYQSGSPTTVIGPPTSGARVLDEFWRDALCGEWRCTVAGTPGTWIQIRPAAVSADPSSGTIPTGYLIWNTTTGQIKIHAGSYSWTSVPESLCLALAGGTMNDGANVAVGTTTGSQIGTAAGQKVAFHGATPVVQAAHIADPSGGATIDSEARTAINAILLVLEGKGIVAEG